MPSSGSIVTYMRHLYGLDVITNNFSYHTHLFYDKTCISFGCCRGATPCIGGLFL